ncbi:hypothetical protein [Spirosoma fluviale]|uniref:Uncharacterized protein n=1 Tax=Spirosoma fluviale TaxID=1597977 RepID=A0A286FC47_9BACT|nr:hypothetical protein [Spirosoma fluviale]SOD80818.1 hypothetical protein SAMN06269250_1577 [Spirosoma fluviale]
MKQLPIGSEIEYRFDPKVNGRRLYVVTPRSTYGTQWCLTTDGSYAQVCYPDSIFPKGKFRDIGYYYTGADMILPPDEVETLKRRRLQYGRTQNPILLIDLNGQPIGIDKPDHASMLIPDFAQFPKQGVDVPTAEYYAERERYWNDLHEKLIKATQ